jgi:hypothetical protein
MNNEWERMWKKVTVAYFKLFQNSPLGKGKIHDKSAGTTNLQPHSNSDPLKCNEQVQKT